MLAGNQSLENQSSNPCLFSYCYTLCLYLADSCCVGKILLTNSLNLPFADLDPTQLIISLDLSDIMTTWANTIILLIADMIVFWRAWVLLQNSTFSKIALTVLLGADICINIADCIWDQVNAQALNMTASGISVLDWVSIAISLGFNAVATLCISWKAWTHYHMCKQASSSRKSQVQHILLLFIESGLVICGIQAIATVLEALFAPETSTTGFLASAFNIFSNLQGVMLAWYPAAVVILVKTSNSPVDTMSLHYSQSRTELPVEAVTVQHTRVK